MHKKSPKKILRAYIFYLQKIISMKSYEHEESELNKPTYTYQPYMMY